MEREQFNQFVNEYQEFTRTTAQYPSSWRLSYVRLGFLNELGEVIGKYKKVLRGDYELNEILDIINAELGDVIWYFVRYLDELDYRASWAFKTIDALEDKVLILDLDETVDNIYAKFAAIPYTQTDNNLIDIAELLFHLCDNVFHIKLIDVITNNRRKLQDRLERNVIKGSGDNR